jgi:hypothetical protein
MQGAIEFYRTIVQGLKRWSASAPRLPSKAANASGDMAGLEPPDFGTTAGGSARPRCPTGVTLSIWRRGPAEGRRRTEPSSYLVRAGRATTHAAAHACATTS